MVKHQGRFEYFLPLMSRIRMIQFKISFTLQILLIMIKMKVIKQMEPISVIINAKFVLTLSVMLYGIVVMEYCDD